MAQENLPLHHLEVRHGLHVVGARLIEQSPTAHRIGSGLCALTIGGLVSGFHRTVERSEAAMTGGQIQIAGAHRADAQK